jgi:microcystin-dependent protein
MSQPYIGEIRMFAGNFAPAGWAFCDGQLMPIAENDALFVLIGTTYGGDGQETFAMPDLRGRVPLHQGTDAGITYVIGENGGVEQVTLSTQQIPTHSHPFTASNDLGSSPDPLGNVTAQSRTAGVDLYLEDNATVTLAATSIGPAGGSQPHENMQPYLGVNFIISLYGIFPHT